MTLKPPGKNDSGGTGEGIAARGHRRRAGVVGLARQGDSEAEQTTDAGHDAEVGALLLQHRTLLDVQLEIGADVLDTARVGKALEVEAARGHRVGHAAPAPVLQVEVSNEYAAPEHPRLEAAPFLVVERHNPQRAAKRRLRALQRANDLEGREHAEGAVVLPSARDGVQVRADEDRTALPLVPAAEHVARRVDLRLQPELLEAPDEPFVRLCELGGPGKAGDALPVRADPRRVLQVSC
jgi:hypothetical protein